MFRQVPAADKDVETLQSLGLRMFNSFATATKLMLSGYYQMSALILRDLLETTFLVEWFRTERSDILRWLDDDIRQKHFRPGQVRKKLDDRDGVTTGRRGELYSLFCELAGHPTSRSSFMLTPRGMQARNGPFLDLTALEAVAAEMGRLAIQVGNAVSCIYAFLPLQPDNMEAVFDAFNERRQVWFSTFYGDDIDPGAAL